MEVRSLVWGVLGALSVACATGVTTSAPTTDVDVEPHEGPPSIAGLVTEGSARTPRPGALVVLSCACLPETRETSTNAQGAFGFRNLPPGTYTVQVLSAHDDVSKVVVVGATERARVRFSLSDEPLVIT